MSVEENKALVLRLLEEIINQKNLELVHEVIGTSCVIHASNGQEISGQEALKQALNTFFDAFAGFRIIIEDIVSEGDKVVVRFKETGIHQGEFEGIEPTGKEATWAEIAIFRIAEGRIAEGWTVEDRLYLMQQLGAIP